MEDTPQGETATPQVLENNTNPSVTTPVVNTDAQEMLRKEAEQAKMRANQLENELKKFKDAQEQAKAKELEEKEEYKTLYEQSQAELNRQREEREQSERQKTLNAEKDALLADFPEAVKAIADEAGLQLTDDSDEAKATFKAKLDKIFEQVGDTAKVTPNNTRSNTTEKSREELLAEYRKTGDPSLMAAAISNLNFVKPFNGQQ